MLKDFAAKFAGIIGRVMNKGTMTCAVQGFAWMIAADGKIEDDEVITAHRKIERNEKLKVFGREAKVALDKAIAEWQEAPRAARLETERAIQDWAKTATLEDKEDFLVAILDVMEGDGDAHPAEMAVAQKISGYIGLPLEKYL